MTEQPADAAGVDVDDDSWKTPELRKAEAELDLSMAKSRKLIAQVEEKLQQMPDVDTTAKPEDIAAIKAAAEKPNAPAEMRALKKKVDAGELTWKDVLEGKALQDPEVRAAMTARLGEMREIYQEVEEGATLEDILEARGVSSGSVMTSGSEATHQQSAPAAKPGEDDYFEQNRMVSDKPSTPSDPPPPPAPPTPPTPPAPHTQEPRRTPHQQRPPEPSSDDYFDDPLAEHEDQKRPEPPRDSGRKPPSRRKDSDDDGDDYFGGSVLR